MLMLSSKANLEPVACQDDERSKGRSEVDGFPSYTAGYDFNHVWLKFLNFYAAS